MSESSVATPVPPPSESSPPEGSRPAITVIEAGPGEGAVGFFNSVPWHDLWNYRELFWIFALRDLKVRYKQTIAGVGWVLFQPILSTLMFLLLLNVLQVPVAGNTAENVKQGSLVLMILSGVVLWRLFAQTIQQGSESIVSNQSLVTKVYFPRLILPASPILSGLVDLAVGVGLILLLKLWFPSHTGWQILAAPLFVAWLTLLGLGAGLWLAALNTLYRDVRQIVPFFLQLWFFLSPVIYPLENIPVRWQWLYACNPTVGPLEGFRWALLGTPAPGIWSLVASLLWTGLLLVTGADYFRRVERRFADWI